MSGMEELLKLYPREYDRMFGRFLGAGYADREVPVPPAWVKNRVEVPQGCENACLAKEIEDVFGNGRVPLVDYVKDWSRVKEFGLHLLIGGTSTTYKRRQWAASATMNEIVMRFGQAQDITVGWVNMGGVRNLLTARKDNYSLYSSQYNRYTRTKLLLIEEPTRLAFRSDEWYFIEDLYLARANALLPTITTISDPLDDLQSLKAQLGQYVTDTFQIYGKYISHL